MPSFWRLPLYGGGKVEISEKELKILKYMLKTKKQVTSKELETKLKLRQPEVSKAMKNLCNREWVAYKKIKKEGKGRPYYLYFLKISKDDIIRELRKEIEEEIKQLNEKMKKIEKMLEG